MDDKLVSIIIPTYNRENILGRAINSVINQTYKNFELLIIDDASSDNTESVIRGYSDTRIKYFKNHRNSGSNKSRNKGLKIANGDYIAFLDSDDEWLPQMLESQLHKFKENSDYGCVYTLAGIKSGSKVDIAMDFNLDGYIYKEALTQGYVSHMITLMVKRECFDVVGNFDTELTNFQDDDICLRLAKYYHFGLTKQVLAIVYTDSVNSITQNRNNYVTSWLKLITKFQDDIFKYAGKSVLSGHYRKAAVLQFSINDKERARETLLIALQINLSIKTTILLLLTFMPSWVYYAALDVYKRKLKFV